MGNILNNPTTFADMQKMQKRDFEPAKKNITQFPNSTLPPIYDHAIGFPNGRKEREMVSTLEELENANVPLRKRDYCAHLYINYKRCHQEKWPWGKVKCKHEAHEYSECQLDDFLLRKKEFERERRLHEREVRRQKKQQVEGQIM